MTTSPNAVIQLPNLSIPVRRYGKGTPLVYLHDELSSGWPAMGDLLAEHFEVIAPELPGFGSTVRPDWLESIDDMAFAIADLVDNVSLASPPVLVGNALGGWLALESMIRGARAVSLVVIGSPGVDLPGDPPVDYFVLTMEERTELFFSDVAKAPNVDEDEVIRNEMMTARLVWQPRYVSPNLLHRLHRVTSPTLVIWGQEDRFLSPAHGEAIARGVPKGEIRFVQGSGHFPANERPEEVANLIIDFFGG